MPVTPEPQITQVRFSNALQSRSKGRPDFSPRTKTNTTVQPTIILAGVNAEGETRFVFLQQASGDDVLDTETLNFVRTLHFAPSGEATQWGTITFAWGDDILAPATQK